MSIPGSVPISGFIAPTSIYDTYATHSEEYGRGGIRTVNDITERNNITNLRRKIGMLVYVISDNKFYQLQNGITNSHWVDLGTWSSSSNLVNKFQTQINGNGTDTVFLINHNLGTQNVLVQIIENQSGEYQTILTTVKRVSTNEVQIEFGYPPSPTESFTIIII